MSAMPEIPSPRDRAARLRAYLARQRWALHREWTQQQEDAWWILNELEEVLFLVQRRCDPEDLEVCLVLARNGRRPRSGLPTLPPSPSKEF